jgi:outer membrane protein insertion porin family
VTAATGLRVGQLAGKQEFETARDRLVATGAFETVGYRFAPSADSQGYVASFQVTEVAPTPVRFEDLGVPDAEITAFLESREPLFGTKIPATKVVVERYTRLIEEFLASKGKTEKIAGVMMPSGKETFELVFRPARSRPAVAEVAFEGNQVLPTQALREAISGVAVGLPFAEQRFRELLDIGVRPLYEARGRIRVRFPHIRTEPAKDVTGLRVIVTVEEGASYNLGQVSIEGRTAVPSADLLKAGDFKPGDVANFALVAKGVDRIGALLRRLGYLHEQVAIVRQIDDARHVVNLTLRIDEGPQFHMGKLEVKGLDLNGEFEIKRLWNMKEGKPFNADYPNYFLNQVRERGVFESLGETRAETKVNDADKSVDVTLRFGAAPPPPDQKKRRSPGGPPR